MSARPLWSLERWSLQTLQKSELGLKSIFLTTKLICKALPSVFREEQQTAETSSIQFSLAPSGRE